MNMLVEGGSRMGSAIPLDRALPSSYRLFYPLSVTVWPQFAMQILTGGFDLQSKSPLRGRGTGHGAPV